MMIPRERKSGWDISSRLLIAKGAKEGGEFLSKASSLFLVFLKRMIVNCPPIIQMASDIKETMEDENPLSEWKIKLNANELDTMAWVG